MGLKFLYYVDTSANWTLFTLGIICMPFGIGGYLLTTPIKKYTVFQPWYHATGIWVGIVFLFISIIMPFARFHPTFLRLAVIITFTAIMISAAGLGMQIDEFISWFENPKVKTFGTDAIVKSSYGVTPTAELVVRMFRDFYMFHKIRVVVVMSATLLGICMLLFRIVTLGLVIFDEFTTRGYDVFTPEEEMMYQAMAERDLGGSEDREKFDSLTTYQPILSAGIKSGKALSDLSLQKEDDIEDKSYENNIIKLCNLQKSYKTKSIYNETILTKRSKNHEVELLSALPENKAIADDLTMKKNEEINSSLQENNPIQVRKDETLIMNEKKSKDKKIATE